MEQLLRPLLADMAERGFPTCYDSALWTVRLMPGSGNNRVYRATGAQGDVALKLTIRDERDRAGREYSALLALQQAGLVLAPTPLLLDRTSYPQPVVVQSWLVGEVSAAPPADDASWLLLLSHLATVYMIEPARCAVVLPPAMGMTSVAGCGLAVTTQLAQLPISAQSAELRAAVARLHAQLPAEWPPVALRLCRCDPNPLNFVRRPGGWCSVDWENSGWGDPAFELADLMAHPRYRMVAAGRWEWVLARSVQLSGDQSLAERVPIYYRTMLAWWAVRLARLLDEVPRGQDARLAERESGWEAEAREQYAYYLTCCLQSW